MKFARLFGLLAAALLTGSFAFADGTVNMVFTGVNGANDGTYYVSPYLGTMNGQNVVLFCDDVKNEIYGGEHWTANVTNLGTALTTPNGFSNTRYGGLTGSPVYSYAGEAYEAAAYLVSQLAVDTNPTDMVNLQHALWDVMNPGTYTDAGAMTDYNAAFAAVTAPGGPGIDLYNFEIITNIGPLSLTGQQQEFLIETPEPASFAMILSGMLVLAIVAFTRARLSA